MKTQPELVLASQSPRRKELLHLTGIPFRVLAPEGVIERPYPEENPSQLVCRLAFEKAEAVARRVPHSLVLGADTVVVCQGKILGKPGNRVEASKMMQSLQGRSHFVWTGVALVRKEAGIVRVHVEKTQVRLRKLPVGELKNYLSTPEPYDKAGGYAIQGTAGKWIQNWEGDYFNVVGLPLRWVMEEIGCFLSRSGKF